VGLPRTEALGLEVQGGDPVVVSIQLQDLPRTVGYGTTVHEHPRRLGQETGRKLLLHSLHIKPMTCLTC
jgi:hypothetical protein